MVCVMCPVTVSASCYGHDCFYLASNISPSPLTSECQVTVLVEYASKECANDGTSPFMFHNCIIMTYKWKCTIINLEIFIVNIFVVNGSHEN